MQSRRVCVVWLGLVTCAFWAGAARAQETELQRWTATRLPIDDMPAAVRDQVRRAADHPTLYSHGPSESFPCDPTVYHWFLDHPDRAVAAWRKLGAQCVDITDRGGGRFGWSDGGNSDVHWDTVYQSDELRIWHAEGQVKAGPLVPMVPFQALVVLRHLQGKDDKGRTVVRQQADLILHTDSRSALVATKVLGPTAPKLAEQYVTQMEMFFSALPWYIQRHPERAEELMAAAPAPAPPAPAPRKRLLPSLRGKAAPDGDGR
ncbi:MAG TPA: hypothetical protein VKA46_07130 [Gemmataceae bacterium]|nr:hypothetical protein [Gemmataceae bacterium]